MLRRAVLWVFTVSMVLGLYTGPRPAQAVTILFEATDLVDTTPGEDLWQYSYFVSDFGFDTNFGFSIFFDPAFYTSLQDPPPGVNADWDVITLQPDPGIPADGLYDALALVDNASLADPFTVSFTWLGGSGTVPGGQLFDINQFDNQSGCVACPLESGGTAAVPEPGTLALFGTGLAGLAALRKRLRHGAQS